MVLDQLEEAHDAQHAQVADLLTEASRAADELKPGDTDEEKVEPVPEVREVAVARHARPKGDELHEGLNRVERGEALLRAVHDLVAQVLVQRVAEVRVQRVVDAHDDRVGDNADHEDLLEFIAARKAEEEGARRVGARDAEAAVRDGRLFLGPVFSVNEHCAGLG